LLLAGFVLYCFCGAHRYRYQHSGIEITESNYRVVTDIRRRLVAGVASALEEHGVRYVISHGNLLELTRGRRIVHDDDVDIRIHKEDMGKWMRYCVDSGEADAERGLSLKDPRRTSESKQKENGIQITLLDDQHEELGVHADVVASSVPNIDYDLAFSSPPRRVTYLGVPAWAPGEEATDALLAREYGESYLIPDVDCAVGFDAEVV